MTFCVAAHIVIYSQKIQFNGFFRSSQLNCVLLRDKLNSAVASAGEIHCSVQQQTAQ